MLETETPTGHATLGTGSLPRRHGLVSFAWVNQHHVVIHPTDPVPIRQGQLEELLRQSGVPSLASELKAADPAAQVVVTSGHKDYAVDAVGGWAADYLMYYRLNGQTWAPAAIPRHVPPQPVMQQPGLTAYAPGMRPGQQDSLAVNLAMSAFSRLHQRLTIVNLPEFDWPLGHLDGGRADAWFAWRLMEGLDADVANIEATYAQAHVLRQTLFVITADHGMETLRHSIPHAPIEHAVQRAGTALARYDYHTGGFLWLDDPSKAAHVAANILSLHSPNIRAVYYRLPYSTAYVRASALSSLLSPDVGGAYRFLLGTMAGPNAPHVVLFLRENTSIQGRNQADWHGDHGGASWNAEHIPLLLAGPGVRRDVTSRYPATLYDVAPTVLSLLGVPPHDMDGIVLSNALLNPNDDQIGAQHTRGENLTPLVLALKAQSHADGP